MIIKSLSDEAYLNILTKYGEYPKLIGTYLEQRYSQPGSGSRATALVCYVSVVGDINEDCPTIFIHEPELDKYFIPIRHNEWNGTFVLKPLRYEPILFNFVSTGHTLNNRNLTDVEFGSAEAVCKKANGRYTITL